MLEFLWINLSFELWLCLVYWAFVVMKFDYGEKTRIFRRRVLSSHYFFVLLLGIIICLKLRLALRIKL